MQLMQVHKATMQVDEKVTDQAGYAQRMVLGVGVDKLADSVKANRESMRS